MNPNSKNTILFQGDSITNVGRDRESAQPNESAGLGGGYAFLAASQLVARRPSQNWQCWNRGISGDKVFQLADRWQTDCLDLEPDIVSILIGVNDFFHGLTLDCKNAAEIYENDFRALLDRTRKRLPNVKFILGEPFIVAGGTVIIDDYFAAFDAYRAAAKRIAQDFGTAVIPYHSIFENALKDAPASYWCPDGVHPSIAGSCLMAEAWLEAFEKITKEQTVLQVG